MKKIVFTILVLFLTGCITQEYTVNKGCEVFLNEPKVNYTIVQEIFVTAYPGVVYMEKEMNRSIRGWKDVDYNDVLSAVFNEVKKIDCDGIMNMRYTPLRNSDGKEIGMLFSCYAFKYIK